MPAYQPETAWKIFQRALFNFDIATGNISTTENPDYSTSGPKNVFNITNEPVTLLGSQCYVLDQDQCTEEQWETVENGTALVRNWIVVDANTTFLFPDLNGNSTGGNGTRPSRTGAPTPSATESGAPGETGAAVGRFAVGSWRVMGWEVSVYGSAVLATLFGTLVML